MALTKISRGLLSTGVSDSSDATAITIDSSENVGIGDTSPSTKLDITGVLRLGGTSSTDQGTQLNLYSETGGNGHMVAYQLVFDTGSNNSRTEKMRIDNSGNVGIGTSSPNGKLTISNSGAGGFEFTPDTTAFSVANSNYIASYDRSASAYRDTVFDLGGAENQSIRFKAGGNVGIGTSSPTQKLHVDSGDALIKSAYDATGTTNAYMYFATRASGNWRNSTIGNTGTDLIFSTGGTGTTHSNATERMRIASTGQVFVGTTSSVDAGQFIVSADPSTYNHITTIPEANAAYNALTMTNSSGTRLGAITVGTSGSTAITYGNSSDYRLKENIVPMEKGLERVKKLKPVQFNWKDDGFSSEGFIAHEIQEAGWVLGVTGEKDAEEMQMVDYGRITPLLVKAIQEQQTQIEALQSDI